MPVQFQPPAPDDSKLQFTHTQSAPSVSRTGTESPQDSRVQTVAGDKIKLPTKERNQIKGSRVKPLSKSPENSTAKKVARFSNASQRFQTNIKQADVQRVKMGMDLGRLGQRMEEATPAKEYYDIPKLGTSANPVGRLGDELYIPKEDMKELSEGGDVMKSKANLFAEINRRAGKVYHSLPKEGQDFMNAQFGRYCKPQMVKEGRKAREPTVQECLGQIRERIQDDVEEISGKPKEACEALLAAFADIDKGADLSNVPLRVDKEAVLSNLSIAIESTENQEEREGLISLRRNVSNLSGSFVTKEQLSNLSKDHLKAMTRNVPEYMSSMDVMAKNDYNPAILKKMEQIAKSKGAGDIGGLHNQEYADRPGYAYKRGNENHREVLAGKMADLLGVQKFLTPKLEATFVKGQLGSAKSPEGLASKWLAEGKELDHKAYFRYTEFENKLYQKEVRGEPVTDDERAQLAELRDAIRPENNSACPGPVSVNMQAWLDLATSSYDSHAAQYMVINGEAHCFDFARFCAPAEAYTDDEKLMLTFRSTFIDHPSCSEEMPSEVAETIMNIDVESLKSQLAGRGLLGDDSFFKACAEGIHQAVSDHEALREGSISDTRFEELCDKFEVSPQDDNAKNMIMKNLKKEYGDLKKESFSKIHPRALEGMIGRIQSGQSYIRSCRDGGSTPTMKGALKAMMPAQAALIEIYSKYSGADAGNRLAIDRIGGVTLPVDLVEWLSQTEGKMDSEDAKAAKDAIASLKEASCRRSDLCTTMDLGDN